MLQYIVFQDFGAESEEWLARVLVNLSDSPSEELPEQDAQVDLEAFLFMSKQARQVVELGHVTILPQSESEVQFRIEFLRKLILGIKALQEDLNLLNAEMIKEL